jgi:hypothetical protein
MMNVQAVGASSLLNKMVRGTAIKHQIILCT